MPGTFKPSILSGISLGVMLCLTVFCHAAEKQAKNKDKPEVFRYPMPQITPPAHHPRLLLSPTFIPILKQRIADDEWCAKAWQTIAKSASNPKASVLASDNQYSQNTLNGIVAQAMIYAMDGDQALGRNAIVQIIDNFERVEFTSRNDVTRDYGATLFAAALVYDWCYPLLNSEQKQAIITHIKTLAKRMEIGYPPYRQGAVTGHGGEAQLLRDQLSAGIAVFDEDPSIYQHAAGRFFAEFVKARDFFYPSHRHHQGIGYGPYRFHWEIYSAWLFKRMVDVDVYSPQQGKVPYHWLYATCPNDSALIDGDTNAGGKPFNIFDSLLQVANYYKDPYLQAESNRRGVTRLARSNPIEFLLFYDPSVKPGDLTELPTTKFFAQPLGGMIARTGWSMGRDSDVAVIEMKGAGYQFNNHMHLDAGAFQIYYRGHLAIDTGAYPKYGTPFDWNFNKRSISHNVMLAYDPDEKYEKGVNDGGQHFPDNGREMSTLEQLLDKGRSGAIISHDMGPNPIKPLYSYLRTDLTPAYGNKMQSYQRHFVTLNLDDPNRPAALLVYDRIETVKPQIRKIWLLQTLAKPQSTNGQLVIDAAQGNDSGRMVLDTLLPQSDRLAMRCVGGPDGENPVFDEKFPILINKHGSMSPFNAGYRTELEVTSPANLEYFLNVCQIMDRSVASTLPVSYLNGHEMDGAAIGKWQVYFSRGEEMVRKPVTFTVKANQTHVLFTGLRKGNWYLKSNAQSDTVTFCKVDEQGSSLYLQLDKGQYELSPDPLKGTTQTQPDLSSIIPMHTGGKQPARAMINGQTVPLAKLVFQSTNSLVDAVSIFKAMGIQVMVDSHVLTAKNGDNTLTCENGKDVCKINDMPLKMAEPLQWTDDVILLPLDIVAGFTQYKAKALPVGNAVYLDPYPDFRRTYPAYVRVSSPNDNASHPAIDAVDGDMDTYFASQGTNVQLEMDMGRIATVTGMKIIWLNSDSRTAQFSIETSVDQQHWQSVFDGKSSGKTPRDQPEAYDWKPVNARLVRITSNGNSQNNWNSICEAMVVCQE